VIVPARNEEESIGACLRSILDQDHRHLQILVVDGRSEDATRAVVAEVAGGDDRVEVLDNPQRTIPHALNVALQSARGRWLVRVDAHSTVPQGYVTRAVAHLRSGRWGGVGGRKDAVAITAVGEAIAVVLGSPLGVGGSIYHHGEQVRTVDHIPFGAYPTALLEAMGGWDERLLANEDFELDHRLRLAGHELLFDPELRIAWRARQSLGALFGQYRRYGRGKALVAFKHPGSLRVRHLAPPLLVAGLALTPLFHRRTFGGLVLAYAFFLVGAGAALSRRLEDRSARRYLPGVFPSMHFGYGIGFWESLITESARRIRGLGGVKP
jgi:cellulose synthase/poly-beta-1,6-N-acetylglucosamine synthase-like glycosyltransferase